MSAARTRRRRHKQMKMNRADVSGPGINLQWAQARKDSSARARRYRDMIEREKARQNRKATKK